MPTTTLDAHEAEKIYESARQTDGPFNQGRRKNVKRREPYHLVGTRPDGSEAKWLDLHGQILCDSMGSELIRKRVKEVTEETGEMETFGPDFTHREFDLAQIRIANLLNQEYGGGPWTVALHSSGTRANEDGISLARAVLSADGDFSLVLNREGYHGSGFMKRLIGHSSWNSQATMPLGVPVTHLDYDQKSYEQYDDGNGRNYSRDFMRFRECQAGSDGKPLYVTEGGVGGVMGFELISPSGIQRISKAIHEKGGAVLFDNVQVMPLRTGDNILSVNGLVNPNDEQTIPDMVSSAKGNGGGYPFAFLAVRKAFLERTGAGHFGKSYDTYGRNLSGVTAFNTIYEIMTAKGFRERIHEGIKRWREGLQTIKQAQIKKVPRVTGKGYMSGLALNSAESVAAFRNIGMEETGIIMCAGGIRGNILRLGIKLDSPNEIIDEALTKIEDTLKKITA